MELLYLLFAIIIYFCILSFLFIQPLGAIIRLIRAKRKDSNYAVGLKRYLGALILFYSYVMLGTSYELTINRFHAILNISSIFAILFGYWHHIIKWHYKFKRIKEYDQMNLTKSVQEDKPYEERVINKPTHILYTKLQYRA